MKLVREYLNESINEAQRIYDAMPSIIDAKRGWHTNVKHLNSIFEPLFTSLGVDAEFHAIPEGCISLRIKTLAEKESWPKNLAPSGNWIFIANQGEPIYKEEILGLVKEWYPEIKFKA